MIAAVPEPLGNTTPIPQTWITKSIMILIAVSSTPPVLAAETNVQAIGANITAVPVLLQNWVTIATNKATKKNSTNSQADHIYP